MEKFIEEGTVTLQTEENSGVNSSCINSTTDTEVVRACGEIKFRINEHKDQMFQMFQFIKRSHYLTDVNLEVDDEVIPVHKIILAAASPYFRAMFTGGLKESKLDSIKMQGVSSLVMTHILIYMYYGEILVTKKTVCELLTASTMFQIKAVTEASCKFLEMELDSSNAIGIAQFAQQHGCMELFKKSNVFIEQHFSEVAQEEEFLMLTECQLIDLIRRDELNVTDEKDVYFAVIKWVMQDREQRTQKMERIIHAVRCQFLSPTFLNDQMENCKILQNDDRSMEYLSKVSKDLTLHKPLNEKERMPQVPHLIYVFGGYSNGQSLNSMLCYDVNKIKWTQLSTMPVPRSGLGAAYLRGMFYVVGGRNILPNGNFQDCDWMDAFDPITYKWMEKSPMICTRNRLGVTVLDDELYAIGGANGLIYHDSVEKYNPEKDLWCNVKPMTMKRTGVSVTVVNRLLYAIGGFNGRERLNSVECYHRETNNWNFVSSMQVARSGAGICSIDNIIFVIGGFDGSQQLSSVEMYNTENDIWLSVPPLKIARSAMSISTWDNKIFVIGGFDGVSFQTTLEIFDIKKSEWTEGEQMPCGRSGHSSANSFHKCRLHTNAREHS